MIVTLLGFFRPEGVRLWDAPMRVTLKDRFQPRAYACQRRDSSRIFLTDQSACAKQRHKHHSPSRFHQAIDRFRSLRVDVLVGEDSKYLP
jgi:hypothetical protein